MMASASSRAIGTPVDDAGNMIIAPTSIVNGTINTAIMTGIDAMRAPHVTRRTFVIEAGKAFPVVIGALYVVGCSSSPTSPSTTADVQSTSTVVNNHSHTANVPAADQLHPIDTTYTSSTSLSHIHMVTLTATQLSTLAGGGSVTVTSTISAVTGTHTHDFTFTGKKQ
jgi:hypothetical protein